MTVLIALINRDLPSHISTAPGTLAIRVRSLYPFFKSGEGKGDVFVEASFTPRQSRLLFSTSTASRKSEIDEENLDKVRLLLSELNMYNAYSSRARGFLPVYV